MQITIGPKRPHTADDDFSAMRRLEDAQFEIEVSDAFFDEINGRASHDHNLEAVTEAVRARMAG